MGVDLAVEEGPRCAGQGNGRAEQLEATASDRSVGDLVAVRGGSRGISSSEALRRDRALLLIEGISEDHGERGDPSITVQELGRVFGPGCHGEETDRRGANRTGGASAPSRLRRVQGGASPGWTFSSGQGM